MKIKDGFMLREVAGSYIVVPIGERSEKFNGMINMNEVGALIWDVLEKGAERQDVIDVILEQYDISEDIAVKDIDAFIDKLKKNDILE